MPRTIKAQVQDQGQDRRGQDQIIMVKAKAIFIQ